MGTVSMLSAFGDSTNTGFSNDVIVSSIGFNSTAPQLLVSGNDIYMSWIGTTPSSSGVFFAKSSDGGSTFSKPIGITTSNNAGIDNIKIAQSNGTIYAVWQSFSGNKSAVFFSKSTDNGLMFGAPKAISDMAKDSAFPQIAASQNHVYLSWLQRTQSDVTNVVFSKSDDNGDTFSVPLQITHHSGNSGLPQIGTSGNEVYLVWEDNSLGNFDVFMEKSNNSGGTFGVPVNISSDYGDSGTPQLAISGNNLYVVWMDNTQGNLDIFFSKSADDGITFTTPVNISKNKEDSGYPQFAVSGNNIYVTWTNQISGNNYDIQFSKSMDGGNTFSAPINISNDLGASGWPQIALDGNIYLSWVDNTPGNYDVYIAKSSDGTKFSLPVDVSNTPNESWYNKLATSSGTVYLSWQEAQNNGGHNVMFSKSTTFVPEFGGMVPILLAITMVFVITISKRSIGRNFIN